jgi:hypothetical protein
MSRHARADLLPWILVGLLAGSATIASAVGLTSEAASAQVPASGTSASETRAGAVSASPATPAASLPGSAALLHAGAPPPARAAAGGARSPQVATVSRAPLPPGQVWQCVIGGERIFSDAPCGEHASIRQLRELNVMDAPPAQSYAYAQPYVPLSAPAPAFAPAPADDSDYADYWGSDVLWAHGYARRNHFPRQDNHIRPQPRPHPHPGRN